MYYSEYTSPLGILTLNSDGESLTGLWFSPRAGLLFNNDLAVFHRTKQWLDCYFHGGIPSLSELPLSPTGTGFQKQVWNMLLSIPYGKSKTYGDIAREMEEYTGGKRVSPQAIGGAVGRNPISIIIPCHRVLGAGGKLTGYAGGLDLKIRLLHHESIPFKEDTI